MYLEIDQADVEVFVDGEKIENLVAGEKKPIEITVKEGEHQLLVKKEGFEPETQEFSFRNGKDTLVVVRLVELGKLFVKIEEPARKCCWMMRRSTRSRRETPRRSRRRSARELTRWW